MATLMSWHNSEGCKGRCDAKCHNAEGPHCDCMCGGRYHGGATDGTLQDRVAQYSEEVFEAAKERAEKEGLKLEALACEEMLEAIREHRSWRRRNKKTTLKAGEARDAPTPKPRGGFVQPTLF